MDVAGKIAIVTGSSTGLGRATATRLAGLGASVVVNYAHSRLEAEETVESIRTTGGTAHAFRADVRRDAECRALIDSAVEAYGGLHILVNNAGTSHIIPFHELERVDDEVWSDTMDTNVKGTFQCIRAAAPHMRAAGEGAVVNVASLAGLNGGGGGASSIAYPAAKAAVIALTKSLARVLGPEIRINCIAPGFIEGRWMEAAFGERYEEARAMRAEQAALKQVGTAESCADAVMGFIQYSTHVTGQTLVVDGGGRL